MIRWILTAAVMSLAAAGAQQPAPQPAADEAAVIEQSRTSLRFNDDGTGTRETFMRVKVQSEAGVQAWGQLVAGYNAASERVEIPLIRVRKADGGVVDTPASGVQELSSPVARIAPVYTDFRQKHVTVQSLRPGDTLEARFVVTVHTALAAGHFWTEYAFNDDAIVLDEQLDIDVPAARKIRLKLAPGFEPTIKDSGDRRLYHWSRAHTVREDPKVAEEKAKKRPWDEPERAPIRLTTFADWNEVGRWFGRLEQPARAVTPDVREKARALTAGRTTDMEKLEALYDYVSKNFRYVSLSLGTGRFQPRQAADVLHDAYGDCKDKHTLLAALIDAAGLQASPVLIHSSVKLDPDFPSPAQFDHVITRAIAGGQEVWLDATPEVAPFRLIAFMLRHKQALLVDADKGSRLVETPAEPFVAGFNRTDVDARIDETGGLSAATTLSFRGDTELVMRTVFRTAPAPQWQTIVEGIVAQALSNATITELKVSDPQATREPFTLRFRATVPAFTSLNGQKVDLKLPLTLDEGRPDMPEAGTILLGPEGETSYRLSLTLPPAAKLRAPAAVTLSKDYGTYRASYAVNGTSFSAERAFVLLKREIPQDRRPDYEAFTRVMASDGQQRLNVDASAIAAAAPAATATATPSAAASASPSTASEAKTLNQTGYEALRSRDYDKAIRDLRRAVELEPKEKNAWNNLGRAYTGLRQYPEAIAAFQKQIEVNPYDEYAHNNLGYAYLQQQKYAEAEAAFKKQLEINPLDKYASANLGRAYVQQQKYDLAVAALEKAAEVTPDDAAVHVQLGKTYANLKRAEPAAAAFAKAVELSPTPGMWNDVAYELALAGIDLERAQRYAESAVSSMAAASRNLDVDHVDLRALAVVNSLAAYWDTLGWVYFARNDLGQAQKFVEASWNLAQHAEVGDHLGQIHEKAGRKSEALFAYAQALNAENPAADVRRHLAGVAGGDAKVDDQKANHREVLSRARTFAITGKAPAGKTADFFLLFSPPGVVDAVAFVEGAQELRALAPDLKKLRIDRMFPDETPARLLRRGIVSCSQAGSCSVVLMLPSDTRPGARR